MRKTKRECDFYSQLKLVVHYAKCLEKECARLGNDAPSNRRNKTLEGAVKMLREFEERPAKSANNG